MTLSLGWILSDFRSWVASLNNSVVLSFLLEDPLSLPPPFPSLVVVLVTSGGTLDPSEVDVAAVIESAPAIIFAAAAAPALPPMVEEPVVDVVEDALWLTWLFWWMSEACSRSCDGPFAPTYPTSGRFVLRSLEVMLPFAGLPGLTARVGQEVTTWFVSHRSWFSPCGLRQKLLQGTSHRRPAA